MRDGSIASNHIVVVGASVALNDNASFSGSVFLVGHHNIGTVAKVVVLNIGRRGVGTEHLGSVGTAENVHGLVGFPRIDNGSVHHLDNTILVDLGQSLVVHHGELGEGIPGSRFDEGEGIRLGDIADQVEKTGVTAIVLGGEFGHEGVSRVDAHAELKTPAGVVLGSVKGVATVGGATGKGSSVLTKVDALVVHDVSRHRDHLCNSSDGEEGKACHKGQGVVLERHHC